MAGRLRRAGATQAGLPAFAVPAPRFVRFRETSFISTMDGAKPYWHSASCEYLPQFFGAVTHSDGEVQV